jgi:dimethylargininase
LTGSASSAGSASGAGSLGTALVRPPGPLLADGIVTHLQRTAVDVERARAQHAAYQEALIAAGWSIVAVEPADDCPDAVFVEDSVVVVEDLAVLCRPGAAARRPEVAGTESAVRALGLDVVRLTEPATLDGGDVLQVGATVYVGEGGRTNAEGVRQLRSALAALGREVIPVRLLEVLHLKSAVTALPDGGLVGLEELVDASAMPPIRRPPEEGGAHLVLLGGPTVLLAASAPRTAEELARQGYEPVVVDIGEFEKLEGCVTCLSVLVPAS